jgi:DNA-directed RNA polymerase subunit alpha
LWGCEGEAFVLDIALPKIEVVQAAEHFGRYKIEPLDPGYGHTLGNALRRVLLTSIPGSAITRVLVRGAELGAERVPGMVDDVVDLVLNLKGIRLHGSGAGRATVTRRGSGVVTAGDLVLPAHVTVTDPSHYLCSLEGDDAELRLELEIARGYGYVAADQQADVPFGEIPLDVVFTPIPRVTYVVENTRIGQATDFDRLLLEIWTDGSVRPGDALGHAARILVQYSQTIADFNRLAAEPEEQAEVNGLLIPADVYDTSIDALDLSTRTYNCLKRADITRVGQVLQMDEKALLGVRNLGQKSMEEIRDKLLDRGYIPREV